MIKTPDNIVKLVATKDDYKKVPVYICPKYNEGRMEFDVNGKTYKGESTMVGDKQVIACDDTPLRLSPDSSFSIKDSMIFDLDNPVMEFLLELAIGSGFVTPPGQQVNMAYHRFKIEDKEKDALVQSGKFDRMVEAANALRDLSSQEMRDLCVIFSTDRVKFNIDVRAMSSNQIEAFLKEQCESNPTSVISKLKDKEYKFRVFLQKLLLHGIIQKDGTKYSFGELLVGADEDYAIAFLKKRENEKLVEQWGEMLTMSESPIKSKAKKTKSVIDTVIDKAVPAVEVEEVEEPEQTQEAIEAEASIAKAVQTTQKRKRGPNKTKA